MVGAARFDRVTAIFVAAGGFVVLRTGAALPRVGFGFSFTKSTGETAAPVSLAGEASFTGEAGLSREIGRAR